MDFNAIHVTRVEGKNRMRAGDFHAALEQSLLRAYCALERIDVRKLAKSTNYHQLKCKHRESLVKILKGIYACISLIPDFILDSLNNNSTNLS